MIHLFLACHSRDLFKPELPFSISTSCPHSGRQQGSRWTQGLAGQAAAGHLAEVGRNPAQVSGKSLSSSIFQM